MKPYQLKKLLQRLTTEYVFYGEAIDLLLSHYKTKKTARGYLTNLIKRGVVEKFEPITYGLRMPALYRREDIIKYLEGKSVKTARP